jgi:Mg2+/Co2+ transporter CorB
LDDIPTSALLIALGVLLIASGFFSVAETSMMALNRYRLRHLAAQGNRSAKLTQSLLQQTDKLLGVILLGNNLLNAASAALVTIITARMFGEGEFALGIGTLAVTFAILVFSEITPKVLGAAYSEQIALPISFVLRPLLKLFYPAVWFVNLFVKGLLWLMRLNPSEQQKSEQLSLEELRSLVLEESHYIPAKHKHILLNLFELENITVDDVMTTRSQIEAIDISADIEEIRNRLATSHHTIQPVYSDQLDEVIGILHVRKVLHQIHNSELTKETLKEIMRPPFFVPAGTPLLTQLQNFQENQRRVGLVVDEYGELQGLVTLEDILEEIVGEFTSQSPAHNAQFRVQEDGSVIAEGTCSLRQLNRKLELHFDTSGPKTINGLILEHLEDIPEPGTSLKVAGYPIEIIQTQDRMVKVVRIFPTQRVLPLADSSVV